MDRIRIQFEFIFDETDRLFLAVEVLYGGESLPLTLATFLQFLFENEGKLDAADSEFSYSLAKLVKRVQIGPKTFFAIPDETDMAYFFKRAHNLDIDLYWQHDGDSHLVEFTDLLPFTVHVRQRQRRLVCHLDERDLWMMSPLFWLSFEVDKDRYVFSNGKVILNPPVSIEKFVNMFLDRVQVSFLDEADIIRFVKDIYTPHKHVLAWQVQADFESLMPQETVPVPLLKLTYEDPVLTPTLFFKYGNVVIDTTTTELTINDPRSKRSHNRMVDMEAVYQNDLMTLFQEHDLPFLLQDPGSIARFMGDVIPLLTQRQWQIESNVPDFTVHKEAVTLDFDISSGQDSSGIDWFSFESNCEIMGENRSLQELTRLMIDNQGYIKTKKGFVKLSDSSQNDLKLLNKLSAFRVNQRFSLSDMLPLMSKLSLKSKDPSTKELLQDVKSGFSVSPCEVSSLFQGTLRDYQQYAINWMKFLSTFHFGGILADDMGLGKTVQSIAFSSQLPGDGPVLIVCPSNVVYNWQREISQFLPSASSIVYAGGNRTNLLESALESDFVITSFGIVKNDIDWLKSIPYKAIFLDEAQYIKNPKTQLSQAVKQLQSPFKLALTGTPIENHLIDLWNIMDFVMPNYLGSKRAFETSIQDDSSSRDLLKLKIRPFILRREKRDVLSSLPEKTEVIVKCDLSTQQKDLYQSVLNAARKGVRDSNGKVNRLNMLTTLLKLRQICIDPNLIQECKGLTDTSPKMLQIQETLSTLISEGHKVVVFSQFTGVLDLLETFLKDRSLYFERIDGSVSAKQRMERVESYQSSEKAGVFLLSLKAAGVGLNLTAADYVLHVDPWWNPAVEAQATDRVHRYGQEKKVFVYKFICTESIEEKVLMLQDNKKTLVGDLIDIDSLEEKSVNIDEVAAFVLGE